MKEKQSKSSIKLKFLIRLTSHNSKAQLTSDQKKKKRQMLLPHQEMPLNQRKMQLNPSFSVHQKKKQQHKHLLLKKQLKRKLHFQLQKLNKNMLKKQKLRLPLNEECIWSSSNDNLYHSHIGLIQHIEKLIIFLYFLSDKQIN